MWWIVLIVLLALAAGVLGTLLELAFWIVVVLAVGIAILGLLAWRALSSRTGTSAR